jgi:uncharacterized membrane protein YidH (DUF202 family)
MNHSGSGKKQGLLVMGAAIVIIIVQLLQMAALHDIKRGLEPDYTAEWMMVQVGYLIIGVLSILLIILSIYLTRTGNKP